MMDEAHLFAYCAPPYIAMGEVSFDEENMRDFLLRKLDTFLHIISKLLLNK